MNWEAQKWIQYCEVCIVIIHRQQESGHSHVKHYSLQTAKIRHPGEQKLSIPTDTITVLLLGHVARPNPVPNVSGNVLNIL